ncbi:Flp/Fap pilin component [Tardiphaga sp. OK246]|nr:Flp/Fap pilin component [Tardiphaga sp. OK246]
MIVFNHFRTRAFFPGSTLTYLPRIQTSFVACTTMKNLIKRFIADETGATAIEYGLIAAGIALAIIAVINGMGTKLNGKFTSINSSLK